MGGALLAGLSLAPALLADSDPRFASWMTNFSGRYARLVITDADRAAGNAQTTWDGTLTGQSGVQSLPTYAGIHEVSYSANWVYIRSTGLGSHLMGPWYLNAGRTAPFPNLPRNMAVLYRFPRNPTVSASKTLTGGGPIGYFADGVAMFDSRDAFSYNSGSGSPGTEANGVGFWNRDAYVNERVTFDPALAHQPGSGQYHYHANPVALRHLLGDNVLFNSATKTYSEASNNPALPHSPILGWVRDGLPVYGPYGYSNATNPASGVRRMVSGFVPRDPAAPGVTTRTTYPLWAVRVSGLASAALTTNAGPAVSAQRPLGRYLEDNDYLGDLGFTLGVDFDLNESNARFCVTPEFPGGTWAYFVCITSNGAPVFPYNIGRQFHGEPTGAAVASIAEPVTTYFNGGPEVADILQSISVAKPGGDVTLIWNGAEGGRYEVESSGQLTNWTSRGTLTATSSTPAAVDAGRAAASEQQFYRVRRTGLAPFDTNGFVYANVGSVTFSAAFTSLPAQGSVTGVTVGGIAATIVSYNQATGQLTVSFNADPLTQGSYNVVVTYTGGPSAQVVSTNQFTVGVPGQRNNVLLVILDDWGFDASPLDNTTPGAILPKMANLASLAAGGMRFTRAWTQPTCAPTRATIMTGRQVFQHKVGEAEEGNLFNPTGAETTLPEIFTNAASPYALALVGKWHLGGNNTGYRTRGNWPEFYGINIGAVPSYYDWTKNSNGTTHATTTYALTDQVNEGLAFIHRSQAATKPWFCWLALNSPHDPFQEPPPALAPAGGYSNPVTANTNLSTYIRMLEALDTELGRLLAGVPPNTDIILLGDNGTPANIVQAPYGPPGVGASAHAKSDLYAGGIHVPMIVKGPSVAPSLAGTTTDKLVHCVDLFSTIVDLAGIDKTAFVPASQNVRSTSIVPILTGTDTANRYQVSERSGTPGRTLRVASHPDYKLIINGDPDNATDTPTFEFYNTTTDFNEQSPLNLAALTGTALAAYNACRAKDAELGGGYSDPPGVPTDTLYLEVPASGVTPPVPDLTNPGGGVINVTSCTVNGIAASVVGRLSSGATLASETDDVANRYWVKVTVASAPPYTAAHVVFPDTPMGAAREYDSISILVKP